MQIMDDMAPKGLITYIIASNNVWLNPLYVSVANVRKNISH